MYKIYYTRVLVLAILLEICGISFAISPLVYKVTIPSYGRIGVLKTPITYKSEIRGVFVWENVFGYDHDWSVIAEILASYGINAMFVADFDTFFRRPDDEISAAINAAHAYGLQYHSVMMVLSEATPARSDTQAILPNGQVYSSYVHCPIRAHDYAVNAVKDYLNAHPNVDGIMLDHIRYGSGDLCYCSQCRAAFEQWLGEGPITDWTPFYPDGSRFLEYAEWRTIPITQLVKDIHDTIKSINPNMVLSLSAWSYFSDVPHYWRLWLGQDTGKWIKEGYFDFVAPMMYTDTIYGGSGETLESFINTCLPYMVAGPEGKIPLVASLYWEQGTPPQLLKDEVEYVRSRGLDGWIIWHYGGPGDEEPCPDLTAFLKLVDMPQTFTISNINVDVSGTTAIITWRTDLPTTSKVEYNISPLFVGVWRAADGFHYWDIDHINGTVVEDNQLVTSHSITLSNLTSGMTYYFRVQSQGSLGITTSEVLTFTTKT